MPNTGTVFDDPLARRAYLTGRTRTDRHLPVTARYVEHIGRLTEPGDTAAQRVNEALPDLDPGAKV